MWPQMPTGTDLQMFLLQAPYLWDSSALAWPEQLPPQPAHGMSITLPQHTMWLSPPPATAPFPLLPLHTTPGKPQTGKNSGSEMVDSVIVSLTAGG